jgi:hypothetical protein
LLQPFADGVANHLMRGGFPQGQMQRHPGAADSMLRDPGVLTTTSLSLLFSAKRRRSFRVRRRTDSPWRRSGHTAGVSVATKPSVLKARFTFD